MSARLPRDLHPVAWWLWALGLAAAASLTSNPFVLLLLLACAATTVLARRGDQPWARSFRLYVWFGVLIVAVRVLFRVLVGSGYPGTVVLDLPTVPLPDWVLGITLLGPVTRESLLGGLYDGLRLATIVICIGAANALANPKRLLRSVPPALYEIGTALVVAVSVLPQLAESVRRVRAAQSLRAGPVLAPGRGPARLLGRVGGLRRVLVPVLEDALEHSLALAAGMDTRGYGRSGGATTAQRRVTGALMLLGLLGLATGSYALLDQSHSLSRTLAQRLLLAGVVLAVLGLVSAGRRVQRTRYRADRWRWPEVAVVLAGVGTAVSVGVLGGGLTVEGARWVLPQPDVAFPALDVLPPVTLLALLGPLLALVAAVVAPPPAITSAPMSAASALAARREEVPA